MSLKSSLKAAVKPALISLASQLGSHQRAGRHPKLWVLMYHRILPKSDARFHQEEPGMLVTPDTFAMHLQEIKRHFDLVRLSDWVDDYAQGKPLPTKACAITFDDGWLDNYEFALPALRHESAPATLFAVADKIGTDFQFWPNIVAAGLLANAQSHLASHSLFKLAVESIPQNPNADQIAAVIAELKKHPDSAIFQALDELRWKEVWGDALRPALMNWQQLQAMQDSGLVDIGSHTCTHRRLTNALNADELAYEIVQSKKILAEKLAHSVDLFCFPNGDYNPEALALVKQNYRAAVTTRRGINSTQQLNTHELVRVGLHDEISNTRRLFRARISGWI